MDKVMHWLAPKGAIGFVTRLVVLTCLVAAANLVFALVFEVGHMRQPLYYLAHALFVGAPLIAFFLTVTVFQIRLQRKLSRLSRKDGLTGLNNRRTFFARMATVLEQKKSGVLLMLDADLFKQINDNYGHHVGDRCLQSIAHTLRRNIRKGDVVGRLGGEEFAIYLQNATIGQARAIGERLTKPIPFKADNDEHLTVTLSIGATISKPGITLDDLVAVADRAMYRAKQDGRARMIFAEDERKIPA